jgi:hypothetical protein
MLNSPPVDAPASAGALRDNSINARPIEWLCVVQSVFLMKWFIASRLRTD